MKNLLDSNSNTWHPCIPQKPVIRILWTGHGQCMCLILFKNGFPLLKDRNWFLRLLERWPSWQAVLQKWSDYTSSKWRQLICTVFWIILLLEHRKIITKLFLCLADIITIIKKIITFLNQENYTFSFYMHENNSYKKHLSWGTRKINCFYLSVCNNLYLSLIHI